MPRAPRSLSPNPTEASRVMDHLFYRQLTDDALAGRAIDDRALRQVLTDPRVDLLELLHTAYAVRRHHWGKAVQVHVLNNAQNGRCPEDCSYCTQAHTSEADIEAYAIKSKDEVLEEARQAYEAGAYRYCMVFAGRGPNAQRTEQLAGMVRAIKTRYPMLQICVSAGLLDTDKARILADAGVDRYNHNLNTSEANYPQICSTHTYGDRVRTLESARTAGLNLCSGLIAGMGETPDELIEVARKLRELRSDSIPVNFLLPFEGNPLREANPLSPEYCLRILCMVRLTNPAAELRCAAGREYHLRSLEAMCLYPANSLFLGGYLNGQGAERRRTYRMIRDAGFTIESDQSLEALEADLAPTSNATPVAVTIGGEGPAIKTLAELRPAHRGA